MTSRWMVQLWKSQIYKSLYHNENANVWGIITFLLWKLDKTCKYTLWAKCRITNNCIKHYTQLPLCSAEKYTLSWNWNLLLLQGLMKMLRNGTQQYVELHRMLFNPYRLYTLGQLDDILRWALETHAAKVDPYFTEEVITLSNLASLLEDFIVEH